MNEKSDKKRDEVLEEVLEKAGGVTKLAKTLGVTKAAVCQWRTVPVRHVEKIHARFGIAKRRLLAAHLSVPEPARSAAT